MFYKKEFWTALFLLVWFVFALLSFIKNGFSSYRVTILFLTGFFGVVFAREAIIKK